MTSRTPRNRGNSLRLEDLPAPNRTPTSDASSKIFIPGTPPTPREDLVDPPTPMYSTSILESSTFSRKARHSSKHGESRHDSRESGKSASPSQRPLRSQFRKLSKLKTINSMEQIADFADIEHDLRNELGRSGLDEIDPWGRPKFSSSASSTSQSRDFAPFSSVPSRTPTRTPQQEIITVHGRRRLCDSETSRDRSNISDKHSCKHSLGTDDFEKRRGEFAKRGRQLSSSQGAVVNDSDFNWNRIDRHQEMSKSCPASPGTRKTGRNTETKHLDQNEKFRYAEEREAPSPAQGQFASHARFGRKSSAPREITNPLGSCLNFDSHFSFGAKKSHKAASSKKKAGSSNVAVGGKSKSSKSKRMLDMAALEVSQPGTDSISKEEDARGKSSNASKSSEDRSRHESNKVSEDSLAFSSAPDAKSTSLNANKDASQLRSRSSNSSKDSPGDSYMKQMPATPLRVTVDDVDKASSSCVEGDQTPQAAVCGPSPVAGNQTPIASFPWSPRRQAEQDDSKSQSFHESQLDVPDGSLLTGTPVNSVDISWSRHSVDISRSFCHFSTPGRSPESMFTATPVASFIFDSGDSDAIREELERDAMMAHDCAKELHYQAQMRYGGAHGLTLPRKRSSNTLLKLPSCDDVDSRENSDEFSRTLRTIYSDDAQSSTKSQRDSRSILDIDELNELQTVARLPKAKAKQKSQKSPPSTTLTLAQHYSNFQRRRMSMSATRRLDGRASGSRTRASLPQGALRGAVRNVSNARKSGTITRSRLSAPGPSRGQFERNDTSKLDGNANMLAGKDYTKDSKGDASMMSSKFGHVARRNRGSTTTIMALAKVQAKKPRDRVKDFHNLQEARKRDLDKAKRLAHLKKMKEREERIREKQDEIDREKAKLAKEKEAMVSRERSRQKENVSKKEFTKGKNSRKPELERRSKSRGKSHEKFSSSKAVVSSSAATSKTRKGSRDASKEKKINRDSFKKSDRDLGTRREKEKESKANITKLDETIDLVSIRSRSSSVRECSDSSHHFSMQSEARLNEQKSSRRGMLTADDLVVDTSRAKKRTSSRSAHSMSNSRSRNYTASESNMKSPANSLRTSRCVDIQSVERQRRESPAAALDTRKVMKEKCVIDTPTSSLKNSSRRDSMRQDSIRQDSIRECESFQSCSQTSEASFAHAPHAESKSMQLQKQKSTHNNSRGSTSSFRNSTVTTIAPPLSGSQAARLTPNGRGLSPYFDKSSDAVLSDADQKRIPPIPIARTRPTSRPCSSSRHGSRGPSPAHSARESLPRETLICSKLGSSVGSKQRASVGSRAGKPPRPNQSTIESSFQVASGVESHELSQSEGEVEVSTLRELLTEKQSRVTSPLTCPYPDPFAALQHDADSLFFELEESAILPQHEVSQAFFDETTQAHEISVLDPIGDLDSTALHDVTFQELSTTHQALDDWRANDIFDTSHLDSSRIPEFELSVSHSLDVTMQSSRARPKASGRRTSLGCTKVYNMNVFRIRYRKFVCCITKHLVSLIRYGKHGCTKEKP